MRLSRFVPVAVAGALLAATAAPAGAVTPGTGSSVGDLALIELDLGEILGVSVISDQGSAGTDPELGGPLAAAQLSALQVSSGVLGIDEEIPLLAVESTGEEQTAEQAVTPMDPVSELVQGSLLPAVLSAVVDEDGPASTLRTGVADLGVLTGLLTVQSTDLTLANASGEAASAGDRMLSLDGLTALDLGSLLAGLGIPISDLPLDTVLELVDGVGLLPQLGTQLDTLGLPVDLDNLSVESIQAAIADVQAVLEDLVGTTCDVVGGLLGGAGLGDLGIVCDTVEQVIAEVNQLLSEVLDTVFGILDEVALLSVGGVDVGVVTAATESLDTSSADVTATLEDLNVGGLDLPETDLLGSADDLVGVVEQVESTLDGILSIVDPGLAGLIDVGVLEETTSVLEEDGTITSVADFTALRLDVNPDLDVINGLIDQLAGLESIGDVLAGAGGQVPVEPLSVLNATITDAVGQPAVALGDGISLRVASIGQTSDFTEVLSNTATPTPATPELPNTGSNDTWMLLMGAVAAAGALGVRRVVRSTN